MPVTNNTRGAVAPYGYFMDDGKEVIVHLTESVAAAGGRQPAVDLADGDEQAHRHRGRGPAGEPGRQLQLG